MVPNALAHELRRERLEMNPDRDPAIALKDAETRVEKFPDGKIGGPPKAYSGPARLADSGQGKGAQLPPGEIEAEEIPLVINAPEMIWPDPPPFGGDSAQLAVIEFDLGRIK